MYTIGLKISLILYTGISRADVDSHNCILLQANTEVVYLEQVHSQEVLQIASPQQ